MTVNTAEKNHQDAVKAVKAAETALTEADQQYTTALAERDRLDKQLDGGADFDAEGLSAQIGANLASVEALSRLRDRRATTLKQAQSAAESARKNVALAELLTLQADIEAFDADAEKATLFALIEDQYADVIGRVYQLQDRLAHARGWAEDATGLGVNVSAPPRFSSDAPVKVDGQALHAPTTPAQVRDWFKELPDERRDRSVSQVEAEASRRFRESRDVQLAHQQAMSDAIPTGSRVPAHLTR